MSELPALSYTMAGQKVEQYGNTKEYPRTMSRRSIFEAGTLWIMQDVSRVASELGIPHYVVNKSLSIHFVEGIDEPGGSPADPLTTSQAGRMFHTVFPTVIVGWKFAVLWSEDPPYNPARLVEGEFRG